MRRRRTVGEKKPTRKGTDATAVTLRIQKTGFVPFHYLISHQLAHWGAHQYEPKSVYDKLERSRSRARISFRSLIQSDQTRPRRSESVKQCDAGRFKGSRRTRLRTWVGISKLKEYKSKKIIQSNTKRHGQKKMSSKERTCCCPGNSGRVTWKVVLVWPTWTSVRRTRQPDSVFPLKVMEEAESSRCLFQPSLSVIRPLLLVCYTAYFCHICASFGKEKSRTKNWSTVQTYTTA